MRRRSRLQMSCRSAGHAPGPIVNADNKGRGRHAGAHLGVAVGGRPAAALARRLMEPVSKNPLLRVADRMLI